VLVLGDGDNVGDSLLAFANDEGLTGHFTAIGGVREATIAFWNPETKQYEHNAIREQLEVAAFTGSIAIDQEKGSRKLHGHIVLGRRNGQALAGHLVSAIVFPTFEVLFEESAVTLRRTKDEATGLALLSL
jgi:predicted DNA-binding protein with PD1-like motif